jgi:Cytochrome bd terminal oxidase subunit I
VTHAGPAVLLAAVQVGKEVVPARAQMATTLGFHIILASLGIALPSVVLLAEFIGLRRRDETALRLARRWSQAMAVLIAVGAVTGTVLSFEMGLLWPGLMRRYGAVLGFPFGVEGVFSSWRRSSPGSTCGAGDGWPAGRTGGRACRSRYPGFSGRCR